MKTILAAIVGMLFSASIANAQGTATRLCFGIPAAQTGNCVPVDSGNPLPVTGTFSASLGGFTAATTGTPISVTTGGVTGTLPAGAVVVATNVGTTNAAYCALGASATTSSQYISPGGGWFSFTVGSSTQLTCITSTSTTTVNMTGGAGLATGTGGGSGGGGSGGSVTQGTVPWVVSNAGTFATQSASTLASGAVASGAYSTGSIASGAFASGALSSGSVASGAFASGALASGSIAAGANVDLLTMRGTKAPGTAAANSLLAGGIYTSAGVTLTDGQQAALQFTATGGLLVSVVNTNANGQATMANSSPVVIASNQTSIPVAATLTAETTKVIGTVNQSSQYPGTAVPYTATATGTTAATTATLTGAASVTTYICGFSIRANATAAATGNATVTGTITGTLNFTQWTAPLASGLGIAEMIFNPCVPASAANTSIAVVSAAPGSGGVVSVTAWGYKL